MRKYTKCFYIDRFLVFNTDKEAAESQTQNRQLGLFFQAIN